jgi:hypothetical protein
MKNLRDLFKKANTCSSCKSVHFDIHCDPEEINAGAPTDYYCDPNEEYNGMCMDHREQFPKWKEDRRVWEDSICDDYERRDMGLDKRGLY